jgi:hypothetical protein
MNNPRFVSFLFKIVDIRNSTMISNRLTAATNEPIIVIQFLLEDGSFIKIYLRVQTD